MYELLNAIARLFGYGKDYIFKKTEDKLSRTLQFLNNGSWIYNMPWYRIDIFLYGRILEDSLPTIAAKTCRTFQRMLDTLDSFHDKTETLEMMCWFSTQLAREINAYNKTDRFYRGNQLKCILEWIPAHFFSSGYHTTKLHILEKKLNEKIKGLFGELDLQLLEQLNKETMLFVFEKAQQFGNIALLKMICDLPDAHKPVDATKEKLIQNAIDRYDFNLIGSIETAFGAEKYQLVEGPIQKNIFTYQLETIVRQLLANVAFTFQQENNEELIIIDGIKYNWTSIIQQANLEHIKMDGNDLHLYKTYLKACPPTIDGMGTKCSLKPEHEKNYLKSLYSKTAPPSDTHLAQISFQEMQAINIYTTEWSQTINGILRGKSPVDDTGFKFAMIQAVMVASGLNKLPRTTIQKKVSRGERYTDLALCNTILIERFKTAAIQGVVQMKGFISTTTATKYGNSTGSSLYLNNTPIEMEFIASKGAYIAPIAIDAGEQEFLIPPTRVKITASHYNSGQCFFSAEPVSDLNLQEENSNLLI